LFAAEAPTLIGNMAHENPLWGAPWIRELLNLGMQGCRAIHFHVGQLSAEATRPTILISSDYTCSVEAMLIRLLIGFPLPHVLSPIQPDFIIPRHFFFALWRLLLPRELFNN